VIAENRPKAGNAARPHQNLILERTLVSGLSHELPSPTELLETAQSDPRAALLVGHEMLVSLPVEDHVSRSTVFRAVGIASRLGADMDLSLEYGKKSVEEADLAGNRSLRSSALMSLAGSLAISGDNASALRSLTDAAHFADQALSAEIEFQRGSILARMGEVRAANTHFSNALPMFEAAQDRESIAMTLRNRAMVRMAIGDLSKAESDLTRARAIDAEDHRGIGVAGEDHALGVLAALRGDLPLAMALLEESRRGLVHLLGTAFESQVSRCEVLLSGGLYREAVVLAREIVVDLERAGLAEDEAEARLVGAQAAVLAGEVDAALSWADQAATMFAEQGRITWAANARLVGIQVQHQLGADHPALVSAAREAAEVLESQGQLLAARRGRLLAGVIGAETTSDDAVLADLSWVAERDSGPIEARLQSCLAKATMRRLSGDTRGADATARSGMRLLSEYQAAIGATDLRMGVDRHGRDLGNLGLSLALQSGRPRRVYRWMELRRGRALMRRPVKPPTDVELAEQLAELRYVTSEARGATGPTASRLFKRQERLQAAIRDRARLTRGEGDEHVVVSAEDVADALGGRTMIQLGTLDGVIWAVVIHDNRFRLKNLGPESQVAREIHSLRFAMRRLARGRGSNSAAREIATRIDDLVFGSLRVSAGPLVVIPTARLHSIPWWALPTCQDRPVAVSPSAHLWYRSAQAAVKGEGTLLAAGPDLEVADAEVRALARVHERPKVISSARSSVERVLAHLDRARLAHIASHAFFQFENPMFSSLRLADGDLNVYDIERLGSSPDLVVLSACDSGFTETHPGEELMGLSSALLSMGTRSIIASVGLVPDSTATKDLMVQLHRGLVSGLSPAEALHRAQSLVADTPEGYIAASSFVCIGAD